jgi:hypothetical protein
MTERRKAKAKTTGSRKPLSVAKRTLKDLTVRSAGPNAGFIMQDTKIVPTGRR